MCSFVATPLLLLGEVENPVLAELWLQLYIHGCGLWCVLFVAGREGTWYSSRTAGYLVVVVLSRCLHGLAIWRNGLSAWAKTILVRCRLYFTINSTGAKSEDETPQIPEASIKNVSESKLGEEFCIRMPVLDPQALWFGYFKYPSRARVPGMRTPKLATKRKLRR